MSDARSSRQTGALFVLVHDVKSQMFAVLYLVMLAAVATSCPSVLRGPRHSRTGVATIVADVQLVTLRVFPPRQSWYHPHYWNCGHQRGHSDWHLRSFSLWMPPCAHALVPGIGQLLRQPSCCTTERDQQAVNLTPFLQPVAAGSSVGYLTAVYRCRQPASSGHQYQWRWIAHHFLPHWPPMRQRPPFQIGVPWLAGC